MLVSDWEMFKNDDKQHDEVLVNQQCNKAPNSPPSSFDCMLVGTDIKGLKDLLTNEISFDANLARYMITHSC